MKIWETIYKYIEFRTDLKHIYRVISLFFNIWVLIIGLAQLIFFHDISGIFQLIIFLFCLIFQILNFKTEQNFIKRKQNEKELDKEFEKSLNELNDYFEKMLEEFKENDDDTGED